MGGGRGTPGYRIGGDDLQPIKARILLMLALATSDKPEDVQRMLRETDCGRKNHISHHHISSWSARAGLA